MAKYVPTKLINAIYHFSYAPPAKSLQNIKDKINAETVNERDSENITPLHAALSSISEPWVSEVVKELCKHGADVNATTTSSTTADITPLMIASENLCLGAIKILVRNGANIFLKDSDELTAYSYAVYRAPRSSRQKEVIQYLGEAMRLASLSISKRPKLLENTARREAVQAATPPYGRNYQSLASYHNTSALGGGKRRKTGRRKLKGRRTRRSKH